MLALDSKDEPMTTPLARMSRRGLLAATTALLASGGHDRLALAAEEPIAGGTLKIAFLQDNTTLVSLDPF